MDNVKPKKHLGQHFLKDQNIARKIASLAICEGQTVVEIGPGTGMLTKNLLEQPLLKLILIEFDKESVDYLEKHLKDDRVKVLHADFLKWDAEKELNAPSVFVGNLPYNITSPIFFRLMEKEDLVRQGVFMIQKEVAERIVATHGNKVYGLLSVLMQYHFEVKYAFTVSEHVFHPKPKVKSAVITLERRQREVTADAGKLIRVVKTAFGQRRKTLRNALKTLSFQPDPRLENWLTLRAEALSVDEFVELANLLQDE